MTSDRVSPMDHAAIAAIVHAPGTADDSALLAAFADDWLARGVMVRGLVDELADGKGNACGARLRDLETGSHYVIFQDLGPGSSGCRIDPGGVVAASVALRRAVETGADLVVANRFGKLEASGSGLAEEMLQVMAAGIPFITLVAEPWLAEWQRFTGGAGQHLAPHRGALDAWLLQHVKTAAHAVA